MKLVFIFLSLLSIGCQNQFVERQFNWSSEAQTPPPQLSEVEGLTSFEELNLSEHKIDFYTQKKDGIKIDKSLVKSLSKKDGSPVIINGSYLDQMNVDSHEIEIAKKNFPEAFSQLMRHQAKLKQMKVIESELLLTQSGRQLNVVNSFITEDKNGQIWNIRSKENGKVVSMRAMGSYFGNHEAQLYPRGPKLSEISRVHLFDLNLSKSLTSQQLQVSSALNMNPFVTDELMFLQPSSEKFDQVQVFYYSQQALRWIDANFKIKLSGSIDIQVHAGAPEKTNMAFYYNSSIRIGAGDGVIYAKIPQDPSIIAHETFHAIVDQLCHLPFQDEGGSINEGLADILTAFHLGNSKLGEVSYLKAPFKRSLENKDKYNDRNGGLYHDSLIFSGLVWELRSKIGQEKTSNLVYNLLLKLGPASGFSDLRNLINSEIKSVYEGKDLQMAVQILKERAWYL